MSFRCDRRGFIFSFDASLAILVVFTIMVAMVRVGGAGVTYEQQGYLRLERYANDALEVMQLTGALDNIITFIKQGYIENAENMAENELAKLLPRDIQFRLVIGDENNPRLDNVYPSAGKHTQWRSAFENAKEIAAAFRVSVFYSLYQLDQNNPYHSNTWHDIIDDDWQAQSFVAGITGQLNMITLWLKKEQNPGELTIEIRDCAGANDPPGSTILASMTTSDVTSETGEEYDFVFTSPASVTAGTYYSIVLHEPEGVGGTGKYKWAEYTTSNVYSGGHVWKSYDSGESWEMGGGGIHDYYFKTYVGSGSGAAAAENIFDFVTLYVWRGSTV